MGNTAELQAAWTDEKIERLRALHEAGRSASQIALELGGNLSRNAIIGKLHRLGIAGASRDQRAKKVYKPRKAKPNFNVKSAVSRSPKPPMEMPKPTAVESVTPRGQRRTLLELTSETCRYPIGDPHDPAFFFCGARPVAGLPYCPDHARVCYVSGTAASGQRSNAGRKLSVFGLRG